MKLGESMFIAQEFLNSDRWLKAQNEDNPFLRQQQAVAALAEEIERLVMARVAVEAAPFIALAQQKLNEV